MFWVTHGCLLVLVLRIPVAGLAGKRRCALVVGWAAGMDPRAGLW